ncbi:MAG: hypothetical protein Q8L37_04390 [Candidatus Gottesmanbacteria bacterium]|nr:hypothetical protein [Candidatus Gottesmanbacteria bacterium]
MTEQGRPEYTDDQYKAWLEDMAPFLKIGNTLYYAIEKAMLTQHKTVIYEKYRLKDWFSEKIDAYSRYPGEIINSIFVRLVLSVDERLKQGLPLADEEWRNLRFFAEKHRSCQPFFVSRQEVAQVEPDKISLILDNLEKEVIKSSYGDISEQAKIELERK